MHTEETEIVQLLTLSSLNRCFQTKSLARLNVFSDNSLPISDICQSTGCGRLDPKQMCLTGI